MLLAALVVILILAFSACSGVDTKQAPGTTPAQPSASDTTGTSAAAATSAAPGPTTATTVAPMPAVPTTAATPETVATGEVNVEWTCDEPAVSAAGSFGTACVTQSRDEFFAQGNLIMTIDYTLDANGDPVSAVVQPTVYGPSCFWMRLDNEPQDSPVVEGRGAHSGVFIGDGDCTGLRWIWNSVWDVETNTMMTTGVLEPVT